MKLLLPVLLLCLVCGASMDTVEFTADNRGAYDKWHEEYLRKLLEAKDDVPKEPKPESWCGTDVEFPKYGNLRFWQKK